MVDIQAAQADMLRPSSYSPAPHNHLSVPGTPNGAQTPSKLQHIIPGQDEGYSKFTFSGKKAQAEQVEKVVKDKGFLPESLVHNEVAWFFTSLGIDDQYFSLESVETIASHIISLYGSKILAYTKNEERLVIELEKETDTSAVFINTSEPGVSETAGPQHEQAIDTRFLDTSTPAKAYRVETYRSSGNVSSSLAQQLRCYFVFRCNFVNPTPAPGESDIRQVSDKTFLEKVSENTLEIYQDVMRSALERTGPVVECYEVEGTRERRLVIGYKQGSTQHYFSALSNLYHWYGIYSTRKYVEQFSNGITIISCYLQPLRGPPIEASIFQVMREASLVYCLPNNPFFSVETGHAVQEAAYAYCAWVFAQHFLNRLGSQFTALKNFLDENNTAQAAVLGDIRKKLREETFTRQSILEVIQRYPELLRQFYVQFAMTHHTSTASQLMPTLSYQRLSTAVVLSDEELFTKIKRTVTDKQDMQVFEAILTFNKAILKTNFFQATKVALSFRLDPAFLPSGEYPVRPHGLFFVIGSEFRGFHLRFKDVARGGIRIIRSRNRENYSINQRNLFDENYALASTQALKNKDIPEGGAKGVILPDIGATPRIAFEKYVDSILDLLIKGVSPGIKDPIVDLHKEEEILFFGPDEGTADMMDWAALHARNRGAPWWKSFTTGKSAEKLGGVPHDAFGMTSLSVRQYLVGIYRELGLKEQNVKKVQTGGPDGDLGSNEILLSKDKTIAIIDGSGVLYEPEGIDRTELTRLARERKMISNFDISKLSKDGYRVLCEDNDYTLPSGEVIPDGQEFRNTAHLRYKADLLVPCGGRPEAINVSNVSQLWDDEGKPNFKYIVEGANLFITQQARLALEKRGVVLFKDASANKGGVTSSSLEVLAGLSLDDETFIELMTSENADGFSDFYLNYVQEIQSIIGKNAASEFNCIWKESLATKKPRAVLTDEIGSLLIKLQSDLEASDLYANETARLAVLNKAIPKTLIEQVGIEVLLQRLPAKYLQSLFSSFVASNFVYKCGPRASQVDFYGYMSGLASGNTSVPATARI